MLVHNKKLYFSVSGESDLDNNDLKKLIRNLPETPGINSKDEYFNCAVLVLLMMSQGEYHFVFEKRSANISQAGEICFPGGGFDIDKDENYKDTAIRETMEELGIGKESIRILGCLDTILTPSGISVDAFCGTADVKSIEDFNINHYEIEKLFTIPVSFFLNNTPEVYNLNIQIQPFNIDENGKEIVTFPAEELGLPIRYAKPWRPAKHTVYVYRTEEGLIWGLTAKLIIDFIKKI